MFAVPHTAMLLAGPLVHSALVQQPVAGTQRLVPGQFLKPAVQVMRHEPEPVVVSQTAPPFDAGVGQDWHAAPQKAVLVSARQVPLQLCIPAGQTPLQALAPGIHALTHSLVGAGQAGTQASPSQVTEPPVGAWQAEHDSESFGPQVASALLSTHLPPQR